MTARTQQKPARTPAAIAPPVSPENARRREAAIAYERDMQDAFRAEQDALNQAWADYRTRADAIHADYERAKIAAGAAYEQQLVQGAA